jgi:hypothetical protein
LSILIILIIALVTFSASPNYLIAAENPKPSRPVFGKPPAGNGSPQLLTRATYPSAERHENTRAKSNALAGVPSNLSETVNISQFIGSDLLFRDPLELIKLDNITPLYSSPKIQGEGVWTSASSPGSLSGRPVIYTTFYRPSVDFPNAVVHMMVVDMKNVVMKYYVGSQEPAARKAYSSVEPILRSRLVAITNAMWQQKHSRGAGAVFRGEVLYPMVDGMATLIVYKDGSVDVREWSSDIPLKLVQDARQLRHLIVRDGMIVRSVTRKGRIEDAEIGLGFLLGGGGKDLDGKHAWFVAHRSAFGIRDDGNLVFVVGHHVGTKDMAKALVLAGCRRGIHGDANPHNIVGNLYLRDAGGILLRKVPLSPEQSKYTLKRYDDAYSKDFFGFFSRGSSRSRKTVGKKRK